MRVQEGVRECRRRYADGELGALDRRPRAVCENDWELTTAVLVGGRTVRQVADDQGVGEGTVRAVVARVCVLLRAPELADIGLPHDTLLRFIRAGYRTRRAIAEATDAELVQHDGITRSDVATMRKQVGQQFNMCPCCNGRGAVSSNRYAEIVALLNRGGVIPKMDDSYRHRHSA